MAALRDVTVEFARLWHRRAVGLLVVLGLAGAVTVLGFALAHAAPPSAADRAAATQRAEAQAQDPMFQEQLAECRAAQQQPAAGEPGADGDASANADGQTAVAESGGAAVAAAPSGSGSAFPPGMDCNDLLPRAEWSLGWSPPDFVRDFHELLQGVTMLLALALALAGITFAGADWAAGTMGTQLTYQPRRGRLFAAKAVALAALSLVVGAVGAAAVWAASYFAAARWGTTEMVEQAHRYVVVDGGSGTTSEPVPITGMDLVGDAVRASTVVGLAALGGYVLAMIFRSSLVATAFIAGYGIIGEGVLRGIFRDIEPYLLSSRLLAWTAGPYDIVQWPRQCTGPCEPTVTSISVTAGGMYLAVMLVVGLVIAAWTFARRDVE